MATSMRSSIRFISRMLPTQKPSKPGMILIVSSGAGVGVDPVVLEDPLEHVVVAVDVAALEGRRVCVSTSKSCGTEPCCFALAMNACRSSPMTSAMQVVETAIAFGL